LAWILLFGVIEYAALKDGKKGRSLSENVRVILATSSTSTTVTILNWLARAGVLGLLLWLIPHFYL